MICLQINDRENQKSNIDRMDNPKTPATLDTQYTNINMNLEGKN